MKNKFLIIALLALFFMFSAKEVRADIVEVGIGPEDTPVYDNLQATAVVNIHKEPNMGSQILGSIQCDDIVNVLALGDKWVKVKYYDNIGYVYKKYLTSVWNPNIKNSIYKLPVSEELDKVFPRDLQQHLWNRCSDLYDNYEDIKKYYVFIIGTIDFESDFNQRAVSKTGDYGLGQTNKKWVWPHAKKALGLEGDVTMLLDNSKASIDCTLYEMNRCVASAGGVCETAYHKYNKGINTTGTDKTSHKMANGDWAKWIEEFNKE